jgi:hypothetical protein
MHYSTDNHRCQDKNAIIMAFLFMARKPNILRTVQLTIATNPVIREYLQRLVPRGLYGKSESEAAERLIAKAIEQLVREGRLTRSSRK